MCWLKLIVMRKVFVLRIFFKMCRISQFLFCKLRLLVTHSKHLSNSIRILGSGETTLNETEELNRCIWPL